MYKALRNQVAEIYEEMKRLEKKCSEENEELLSTLRLVAESIVWIEKGKMNDNKRKMTAPIASVGADVGSHQVIN